jgi:hypothetical protein
MGRLSVSLNDRLDNALTAYINDCPDAPVAQDVVRTALCEYLAARGFIQSNQQLERRTNVQGDNSPSTSNDTRQSPLTETIEAYIVASEAIPPTPPIVLDALRRYLHTMGASVPKGPLRAPQFRTIEDDSGHTDTSIEHDRVLTEMHP